MFFVVPTSLTNFSTFRPLFNMISCCADGCSNAFCNGTDPDDYKGRGPAPGCGRIQWPEFEDEGEAEAFFDAPTDEWRSTHHFCKTCAPAGAETDEGMY